MKAADVFESRNYKQILKNRVQELKASRPQQTLRYFALKIPVQYTYLSKVLNSKSSHLSEDHLYEFCRLMDFFPNEVEFILMLRSFEVTESSKRREELAKKIETSAKANKIRGDQEGSSSDLTKDFSYLFQPMAVLVHAALFIKEFQKNPRALCSHLGFSSLKLSEILKTLDRAQYIVLDPEDSFKIIEVKTRSPYFTREHALMRAHQSFLKTVMQSRLHQTSEAEKESFMVTFTSDEEGMLKIRQLFQKFLQEVQEKTSQGKHNQLYQMSFDFLKWF